jgi:mRNA-degrading endonuclease toxin of MazEF toxin-antitoxin module
MPFMTSYKQGDVLLVPFPFTNQRAVKQRPAVVLSGEDYNRHYPDVILAAITSKIAGKPDEVVLIDWQIAGLLKPSAVKPVLSSIDTKLIRRHLGTLSNYHLEIVKDVIKTILELT